MDKNFKKISIVGLGLIGTSILHAIMANKDEETNNINSDVLGRIKKMNDVHFIDSSVLPVLSPGPITLIVMLNAYRIVNEAINET